MYGHIVTMYIRKTTRKYKDKTYTNYLLVESRHTSKGPRQKVICSLGDLEPRPRDEWLKLARKVEAKERERNNFRISPRMRYDLVAARRSARLQSRRTACNPTVW